MIEPVELSYEIKVLPPGRLGFRRWRWELWHGPRMLAAGWRASVLHAQGALRMHSLRYAHRLHGLHLLRATATAAAPVEREWGERTVVVEFGELKVVLNPLARVDERPPPAPAPLAAVHVLRPDR